MAKTLPPMPNDAFAHPQQLCALILQDSLTEAELIVRRLKQAGFDLKWTRVDTEAAFLSALEGTPHLILADHNLSQLDALRSVELLRARGLDLPYILISDTLCEEIEIMAIRQGVDDCVHKEQLSRLGPAVLRALQNKRLRDEQKRANEKLRVAEEVLRNLAEHSLVGIQILQDGKYVYANSKIAQIFGYTEEELYALDSWTTVVAEVDREMVIDQARRRLNGELPRAHYVFRGLRKDQTTVDVEIRSDRIELHGRMAMLGMMIDVTDRRKLEEQFRQSQKMDAFGKLAGGVAHDFNNLLTIILGCCEFLEEDTTLNSDSRELAEQIRGAGERAAALTRQLLAFSRQQLLHPKVLKLNDVIMKSVRLLERLIGEDVAMTTSLSSRLWSVKVDEGQMEQVLMNLAVNARDAMPQGGKLVFQTANVDVDECYAQVRSDLKPGPYVVLSVSDTGCGMDENTRARVFEPFFTTKEPGKGTGLGLATVFGIVKQSGGYVAVYSELGKGTVITIYLPKVETGTAPGKEDEPQPVPAFGMETVLLVEDSDMVRNVVCRSLRSQGYTVLEARDGIEALAIFQEHRGAIHLVLTDVVMPEMSGRQLSEQLLAWQPDLKMLFMSGFTDDSVVRHGVLTDETNFIQKPFSAASLTQKIREILDRPVQ